MSLAVGLSSTVASIGAPANTGILQGQLNRYEIQLADWRHCPSRTTPQGQQKIAELQAKADAVKAQLQEADQARSAKNVVETPTVSASTTQPSSLGIGTLIDVHA